MTDFREGDDTPQLEAVEKKGRDKQKVQAIQRADELNDFRILLGEPAGRRVLWRILQEVRIFGGIVRPANLEWDTARRSVGLWLLQELEIADPMSLEKLRKEQRERGSNGN